MVELEENKIPAAEKSMTKRRHECTKTYAPSKSKAPYILDLGFSRLNAKKYISDLEVTTLGFVTNKLIDSNHVHPSE
ncbi:hypothetical protein LguiA_029945 [Lonicera macranthoides]